MHAWESIQNTLNYIEDRISEEIQIEELAEIAGLSLFYYQRLFTRLVKKPVREYIRLRRLARACEALCDRESRILNVAVDYGFGSRETFTRVNFLGVTGYYSFTQGKMLGEKTGADEAGAIWDRFFGVLNDIPRKPGGRILGVSYPGDAPEGYSSYFVGAEQNSEDSRFDSWLLPAREYVVCSFETDNSNPSGESVGRMMKFTRFWLKRHGLIADGFFPEMYYNTPEVTFMEMWIPFRQRKTNE